MSGCLAMDRRCLGIRKLVYINISVRMLEKLRIALFEPFPPKSLFPANKYFFVVE